MQNKILLWGYYGQNNAGDDIILLSLINLLRRIDPTIGIRITSNKPGKYSLYDVTEIDVSYSSTCLFKHLKHFLIYLKAIRESDTIFFGGGTQLFEKSKNGWKSLLFVASCLFVNNIFFSKPVHHIAVGIDKPVSMLGGFLLRFILNSSSCIFVRDKSSYEVAKSLCHDHVSISLVADLAYSNDVILHTKSLKNNRYNVQDIYQRNKIRIGLSLIDHKEFNYTSRQGASIDYTSELLSFIDFLSDLRDAEIYLFAFQTDCGKKDNAYIDTITALLRKNNIIVFTYVSPNINALIDAISNMDLFVAMRLHATILCYCLGIPVISIAYADKVKSEAIDFAMQDYVIDLNNLDSKELIAMFCKLSSNRKHVEKIIRNSRLSLQNRIDNLTMLVTGLLANDFQP